MSERWRGILEGSAVSDEFASDLGDPRRSQRLQLIGERLWERPDASFVEVFDDSAEREGFYRFVRNDHIELDDLLSAHREQVKARAELYDEVLVIHDTTEFRFPLIDGCLRDNLHSFSKTKQGYRAHMSLVASADGLRAPLGFLGLRGFLPSTADDDIKEFWNEQFGRLVNLNDRWFDAIVDAEQRIGEHTSPIHVGDREADFFSLLGLMREREYRYVFRAKHNRKAKQQDSQVIQTLQEVLSDAEFIAQRTISLSARSIAGRPPEARQKQPPRARRKAKLHFRYTSVVLQPPPSPGKSTAENQPSTYEPLTVTAIEVVELAPPEGEQPIRWVLLTSEAIDDIEGLLKIVDIYRTRWLIEEAFKAIKTGCAYQKRQMASATTLLTTLAILLPIAWRLLLLRHVQRNMPDAPGALLLSEPELKVLRAKSKKHPLPKNPTASDVCIAIARVGGYAPQNGPPGWQVLGRGFQKLLTLTEGYLLMLEDMDL